MTITAQQRAFLFCASPFWIVPALARSGAGVDRLLPSGDGGHGGPIEPSWAAEANGWMPTGEGPSRRFHIWNTNGPRLELKAEAFGDVLVTVTRQQLRAYARSLPYPSSRNSARSTNQEGHAPATSTGCSRRHSTSPAQAMNPRS
ncbi:hypothetical protein GS498_09700 [Rhodococcus hoagii]|nr:hypothetical protein [Prescottella equi]